jgi:replicative DNA helicase
MPIREVIDEEKQAKRNMLINDGDMSFISSDDEDFRWIDDFSQGNIEVGLDTGDAKLDEYFRYKKEFVIMNGHSNVGKTTTALYLIANAAIRHGGTWLIYSSENRTASVKMQLMQFAADRKVGDMTYAQRKQAYKWVQEHFTIINNNQVYSYSDIIVFMEKVKAQQHIDAVFVDPYNSLKLDMKNSSIGVHDYHYEAASEFLTYSTANNVAVWLNMHAVTEAQRRKGPDGLPVAPFAEDTEGGGKFVNRADCFITIHRKVQAPDHNIRKLSEFHVRKVREVETGGQPTPFDQPYNLLMNLSHTGFTSWDSREKLFQPIHFEGDAQSAINFSEILLK